MKICTGSSRFNETNYELISFPNFYGLPMNLYVEPARHTGALAHFLLLVSLGAFYATMACHYKLDFNP